MQTYPNLTNFWIFYLIFFVVFGTGFAVACGVIAYKKDHNPWLFALLGFFTTVIGLLITLFMTGVIPITRNYYTYPAPPFQQGDGQYYYGPQAGQGSQAQPAAYCQSCGAPTYQGEKYCTKCGFKLPGAS